MTCGDRGYRGACLVPGRTLASRRLDEVIDAQTYAADLLPVRGLIGLLPCAPLINVLAGLVRMLDGLVDDADGVTQNNSRIFALSHGC